MKNFFSKVKSNYPIVITSIILYQIILTIFFFSSVNLHILCWMIVFIAITIIIKDYKPNVKRALKKISSDEESEEKE